MNDLPENDQLKCGLSLSCTEISQLSSYTALPECVEWLEISGELAAEAAALRSELSWMQEFDLVNFRNLLSSTLSSMLTPENQVIVPDYKKQLRELMQCARECGAREVGIDPDWEALYLDPLRRKIFDDVLRSTAGDREYFDMTLSLTVRIPGSGQTAVGNSLKLLHKLSNYRVNLALDIYPHELLNSQVDWPEILKGFRFDVSCIRFCYVSDLGNRLLYRHIEPVIKTVKAWQRPLNIAIAPSAQVDTDGLEELINAIHGEATAI